MKLLQWNIWYKEKIENIAKFIREIDPDIVCLQELSAESDSNSGLHTAEYLRDSLNLRMFYKDSHIWKKDKNDVKEMGNGIFSKFPIASGSYTVIYVPQDNSPEFAQIGRNYLEAVLKIGNSYLTVGTTHLTGTPGFAELPIKTKETDILITELRKNTSAFLFTGDFNAVANSQTFQKVSTLLQHAGPDIQEPTWPTKPYEGTSGSVQDLKLRLDYVFATNDIVVHSARILQTQYSDHLPILVEFDMAS